MLGTKIEQKEFRIGKVTVGGKPWRHPTVLIGSIFHKGQRIVKDHEKGVFDRKTAEALLNRQDELSDITGNPCMVDVVGSTSEALKKYLEFVAKVTDAPILIDGLTPEIRISSLKYAVEIGLKKRIVYNSLNPSASNWEIKSLRETKTESAVLLAFSSSHVLPKQKIRLLRGSKRERGLLEIARQAGVVKPLIDVAVLDVPSVGLAAEAISLVKKTFGFPTGSAPCNALQQWKRSKEFGKKARNSCLAAMGVVTQTAGADFILYGSLSKAEIIFPVVAMTDALTAYAAKWKGAQLQTENHPLFKIF